jgi:hypothetical protein
MSDKPSPSAASSNTFQTLTVLCDVTLPADLAAACPAVLSDIMYPGWEPSIYSSGIQSQGRQIKITSYPSRRGLKDLKNEE